MGVGCKRGKYQFSTPALRALPLDTEFLNQFLQLQGQLQEVFLPTYLPTIFSFLKRFFYIPFPKIFQELGQAENVYRLLRSNSM